MDLLYSYGIFVIILSYVAHLCYANDDPHGGVPMGVSNIMCDNAKNFTSIDWSPLDVQAYTCQDNLRPMNVEHRYYYHCDETAKRPIHVCYPEVIHYDEDIPTSGPHRPLWPKYGEYTYVPAQRWLHSLEHGSIVFLYHPCTDPKLVEMFKVIARGCMRRHIISPYKNLPDGMNFAVLSWRCKLLLSHPSLHDIVQFIRGHALHSPEASVFSDGQYDQGLIRRAAMVSDKHESRLCPHMDIMSSTIERLNEESLKRRQEHIAERHHLQNVFRGLANVSPRNTKRLIHHN